MEATEAADTIVETAHHHESGGHVSNDTFRKRVGVLIAVFACALALVSMGGRVAMKQTINKNIEVSDTYNFFQARNIRQSNLKLSVDQLELTVATRPDLGVAERQAIDKKLAEYRATIDRYESDPVKGDGKKELLAKADEAKHARDHAQEQDEFFEFAEAFLEISLVLASTAILTTSRSLLWVCISFAACGAGLALWAVFM